MDAVTRLAELLLAKLRGLPGTDFTTVLAPAMGGLVIGQEVARQAGVRYLFAEKENNVLVLRRGFRFAPGPVAVAMLVDRSAGSSWFDIPAVSLLELSFPTYAADALPPELARLPVEKPGS